MTPEMQTALWGIAAALPLAINLGARRDSDALGLSAMILLIWCFSRVLWALHGPPESVRLYPLIDLAAGITAVLAWRTKREGWKLALAYSYVGQTAAAAAFWLAGARDESLILYLAFNNACFAFQLFVCAWPGGRHVVGYVGSWLSDHSRKGGHART